MVNVRLIRITTVPISLKLLLTGQMSFMKKAGIDVTMISAQGKEIEEVINYEGVLYKIVPFTREMSLLKDLYCLIVLIWYFLKTQPDIVHTHTPKAGLLGMIAAKITRVPLRIHTIAGLPLMTASGWKKRLFVCTEKLTYWGAQYVLPNSETMRGYMLDQKLCHKEKLNMIGYGSTNGIDLRRYNLHVIDANILKEIKALLNYDEQFSYVLAVGRVVKDKGIIELVESFLTLQKKMTEQKLKLIVLGPIEDLRNEEKIPARILDFLLNHDDITHIQWSDHVEYFMAIADILVHASHREGFPNVLLQSGAMKCPIVCSNIPGNIDIVNHQVSGLLFEKGSAEDLTDKLEFALKHPSLLKLYSQSLRQEIEEKYDRKFVHREYLRFYKEKLDCFV